MRADSTRRTVRAVLLTLILLAGTACGADGAGGADDGKPQVMAAFYPLRWITERVGGPDVRVTDLTKPGVEPHDLELTPRQAANLETADLTVYLAGVQPALDEAVAQYAPETSFDVASVVSTLPAVPDGPTEGERTVAYDPHIWLDPTRFATVAVELGERLAAVDPPRAQTYRDRARAVADELGALDGELMAGLRSCASRSIVTSHSAFGYLADRYDLRQIGISGIDPDAEPSPARLAEVATMAREEQVTTIFTEALVSPKVAEVLAKEVGARTAVLDPIESEPESGDYLSAMRHNLTQLRDALGCP